MATGSQNLTTYVSNTLAPRINNISLSNFIDGSKLIYTYYGGGNSINDKPTNVDAFGAMSFKTADSWYGQLLMSSNQATGLYWRTATSLSGGWCKLLDSSNYTDYTVTKTGDGASGTWGISINGNAATATKTMQDGSGNVITSKYVTIDTVQAITGAKIFKDIIYSEAGVDNPLIKKTVDLSTLDANTYYPVTSDRLPYRGFNHMKLAVHLNSGTKPSWSTHNDGFSVILDVLATAHGWGTIANRTVILQSDYSFVNAPPASYSQMGHSSTAVFWLRGGGKYFIYTDFNTNWTIQTAAYTVNEETVQPTTTRPAINVTRSIIQTDIDGNAATATKATQDGSGNVITSKYVTVDTAQTITGGKSFGTNGAGCYINGAGTNGGLNSILIGDDVWLGDCNVSGMLGMKSTGSNCGFYFHNSGGTRIGYFYCESSTRIRTDKEICVEGVSAHGQLRLVCGNYGMILRNDGDNFWFLPTGSGNQYGSWAKTTVRISLSGGQLYGAAWNDYAECRATLIEEPGRVLQEDGLGTMYLADKRLIPGCKIVSDTYGYCEGETQDAKTPVAVSGRVLVYPYRDRSLYKPGAAVCSAPDGTVDIMTREEIMMYPDCIIGTVSEIPTYDVWKAGPVDKETKQGANSININGRIWIYVR